MARRGRRILLTTLAVLVLLPTGIVLFARARRTSHSNLMHVHNSIVHVRNFFSDFYGARVGDRAVLFDAGVDLEGGPLDALLGELQVAGRDAVSDVFLTHGHFDHVAASPLCKKARIHVGIRDSDMMARRARIYPWTGRLFEAVLPVGPIFATDAFIDVVSVPLGGKTLEAWPCPGHSPGSYVILYDGVLFAGDSIQLKGDRLDFAMSIFSIDMAENKRSIAALKAALAGKKVDVVCTGHQGCTRPEETQKMLEDLFARAGS
jgi:glyoxylase-like metal-dependent hydrolase (beta-lactamase superfamily II)